MKKYKTIEEVDSAIIKLYPPDKYHTEFESFNGAQTVRLITVTRRDKTASREFRVERNYDIEKDGLYTPYYTIN